MGNTKIDINLSEPTDISLAMINDWELPPALVNKMDNYFILHWTAKYFYSCYSQNKFLTKDGKKYLILTGYSALSSEDNVALSFRYCHALNNLHGYVLVRRIK